MLDGATARYAHCDPAEARRGSSPESLQGRSEPAAHNSGMGENEVPGILLGRTLHINMSSPAFLVILGTGDRSPGGIGGEGGFRVGILASAG